MAMGHVGDQALAFLAAPAQPRHLGVGAGFVDEDQLGGVKPRLGLLPFGARLRDVRAKLLAGVQSFF